MSLTRVVRRLAKFFAFTTVAVHLAERLAVYRIGGHPDPTALADFTRPTGETRVVVCEDGSELATVSMGEGDPIVLVHGYTANLANWSLIAPELVAHGHRVVMFDQRGHGLSTVGSDGFGIAQLGSDLATVLVTLEISNATVVGHSMGGIALQSFLIDHPAEARRRVAKVVMLSTLPRNADRSARTATRISMIKSPLFERIRMNRLHGLYFASKLFGPTPAQSQVEAAVDLGVDCDQSTMHGALLPLLDFDFVERLGSISHPTIVICGTEDKVTFPAGSQILAEKLADADLHWLDGVGHVTPYEDYERVVELIVAHASSSL